MKCTAKKITVLEFKNEKEFENLIKPDFIYSFEGKYRLIYKGENPYKTLKNTYIEYFKTLEYWEPIRDF